MKKIVEKKEKAPPEKYFQKAIMLFFGFHKGHFRDEDGYALAPNWDNEKRGMEMKGLKLILTTLREISEGKGFEWTEEKMTADFNKFLERAINHSLVKKNFLCCMMNRYKFDILSASFNPHLSRRIREVWYLNFPEYTKDDERDKTASEIFIGFLKQQYIIAGINFSDESVMGSVNTIIAHVRADTFWSQKSMRSVVNNLQEFVTKIKSSHGTTKTFSREGVNEEFNRRNYGARQSGYNAGGQDGNKSGT